jgi:predicted lipid-binding transport protein (Tim44 family)
MEPFPHFYDQMKNLADDIDAEESATMKMYDTEQALMDNRPPAAAPGVDLSPVVALDPSFDGQQFLTIARESFYTIREARTNDNLDRADAELSPQLLSQLHQVIQGDVASHRHHLLPGLEVRTAVIQSADVTGGKVTLVVRFHLTSEELDRDSKGKILAGDLTDRDWDEVWTFWRDPGTDPASVDSQHLINIFSPGGWLFAHRGWVVTAIERLGEPDPLDPTNL